MTEEKQYPCGCGRSASGYCDGSHNLSEKEWFQKLQDELYEDFDKEEDQ